MMERQKVDWRARKWLGMMPQLDPSAGWVVVAPPGEGPGNWAGAPSALYDDERGRFYLSYRVRKPLASGRGYETRVAESADGRAFTDIWVGRKEEFGSSSIERSCLVKTPQGGYRLYVSYVAGENNKWQIDMLEAASPEGFSVADRQRILRPDDVDSEGVKDPYILLIGGVYYMYVPHGPKSTVTPGATQAQLHGTGNVFTTGLVHHPTALALSLDGVHFQWKEEVLRPGSGWDRNVARLACIVYVPPVYLAFYDGRITSGDVYEDRTGLAVGLTPYKFDSITPDKPILFSPHSTGALRYMDIVPVGDQYWFFYEMAREDGAHDLRVCAVPAD
ncbi:MAG: hypothetical protein ACYC3S_05610 [Chloroflexota bacterium]